MHQSADLLRGSHFRKEFVLGDLAWVATLNQESQQKVNTELDGLARDTQSYEEQLRGLREQLKLKESQNKELYRIKVQ